MAKKKKGKVVQMLSPVNYIRKKSCTLPIHECWITNTWEETKKANIIIARKHNTGNITLGLFLVDLLCLGVKDCYFHFNIPEYEYKEILKMTDGNIITVKIDYALAHNIIYAGLEFAEGYGFKPHKDFYPTMRYFLEEDNDDIELIEIACGENGKPMYIHTPYDPDAQVGRILSQLKKTAGEGNYYFIDESKNPLFEEEYAEDEWGDEPEFDEKDIVNNQTFQFKIQIRGITNPPVWRRVTVPSYFTFFQFHYVIQSAFGWFDAHLFQFTPRGYGSKPCIGIPSEDDLDFGFSKTLDAQGIKLSDVFKNESQKFIYIYDFGDDWIHNITLEKIIDQQTKISKCPAGKGKCPPEDCGGVWGFENLKKILADKTNPEYEESAEWLDMEDDEVWDSKEFDIKETNDILAKLFTLRKNG